MKENKTNERRKDVSDKLLKIADSLRTEGIENNDMNLELGANMIMLIGGILTSDEDLKTLSELCAMYSAKKILDNMSNFEGMDLNDIFEE
jgi:hypothetical protein